MPDTMEQPGPKPTSGEMLGDCERRYRIMAENADLGMFQVLAGDPGRVIWVNRAMAVMLGYDNPEMLQGNPAQDLFADSLDFRDLASGLLQAGSAAGREIRLKRRDGSEIWVSIRAWRAGTSPAGQEVIDGLCQDITERQVFEQEMHFHESELNRYALALTLANRKLNLLSSITRHDILNKLTGLQGYLDLIREDFSDPALIEYVRGQEEILAIITQQILFTRDYQDIGIHTPQWFDAGETIRSAAAAHPLSGITVSVDITELWIFADPMLEKVFYNLIDNAANHGKNLTQIRFFSEVSEHATRIICEDDGGGVPERFKKAIFVREHFTHTGFGLFLSREILGITGMSIVENGEPGRGARFVITIPENYYRHCAQSPSI